MPREFQLQFKTENFILWEKSYSEQKRNNLSVAKTDMTIYAVQF